MRISSCKSAGKTLQNSAGRLKASKATDQHKMRKSLKKLRYTVEFLAPLYPKQRSSRSSVG